MPYGRCCVSWSGLRAKFQSLIWVACPTGARPSNSQTYSDIGFNPSYGLHALRAPDRVRGLLKVLSFNPSYGLHALRARGETTAFRYRSSFNPSYGLHALRAYHRSPSGVVNRQFQSLIWVACPTGNCRAAHRKVFVPVSIPHMGCMPYGRYSGMFYVMLILVSIPHMGCMPYGLCQSSWHRPDLHRFQSLIWVACPTGWRFTKNLDPRWSFNPSYGLHALRASYLWTRLVSQLTVSIPHMGCMPYGPPRCAPSDLPSGFQSLIWVACPTGLGATQATTGPKSWCFNPSYGLHALRAIRLCISILLICCFNPSYGLHALRA